MRSVGISLLIGIWSSLRSRAELQTEIVALHHQLALLRCRQGRPGDTWFLDEVFLSIEGERRYL